jgi:protein involved in polysaccharide export with SLBB domain
MSALARFALLLSLVLAPAAAAAQAPDTSVVTLRPGDLVRVQIYRETDLNGEFLVDQDGVVVLPLVGPQVVTGLPMRELRDRLVAAYREHLRNPSINITPLRRVNVLGEVQRPGVYAVDPTVSVADAVSMAGGATPMGDLRRIRIIRGGETLRDRVGAAETLRAIDIHSGDQVLVDRRSWFERNSTFVVSTVLSVTSIIIALVSK